MNTENLKEFIVLAETKNFWEASERLYMNQSTLQNISKVWKMSSVWLYLHAPQDG